MTWRKRISQFFDTSSILTYVIGTATLTIALQWLYDLAKMLGASMQDWGQIIGGLLLAAALVVISVVAVLSQVLKERHDQGKRRAQVRIDESRQKKADQKLGMITLVSPRSKPDRKVPSEEAIALQANTLKACWLLASRQSLSLAHEIRDRLTEQGVQVWCAESEDDAGKLIDAESVVTTYNVAARIMDGPRFGLSLSDIVSDITGSQKPAGIGLALASTERGVDMVYVKAERDKAGIEHPEKAAPILIKIDATFVDANANGSM